MRIYQCDCCKKIIDDPFTVKMKEFYLGFDTDCSSDIVIPIERKKKIKIQLCDDCYKGLHLIAEKRSVKSNGNYAQRKNREI